MRLSSLLVLLVAGCGATSGGGGRYGQADMTTGPRDMGLGLRDMAMPPQPDLSVVTPPGMQIAAGSFLLDAITDDGWIIAHDPGNYVAIQLSDGTKRTITSYTDAGVALAAGKVAFSGTTSTRAASARSRCGALRPARRTSRRTPSTTTSTPPPTAGTSRTCRAPT